MLDELIQRINELSRKSRTDEGLTEEEKKEQSELRQKYRECFKQNFVSQLDTIKIKYEDGSEHKIIPKN